MFHNGWSVKNWMECAEFGMAKNSIFAVESLIHAPKWFTENFPAQPMDGELWMGRGTFDRLSGIVRKKIPDERDWKQVRYMLFELPESSGNFHRKNSENGEIDSLSKNPLATGYSANTP